MSLGGESGGPRANPPEYPGLWVRATINLPHLRRDYRAYVNPEDSKVADALAHGWLVVLPGQEP